MRPEDTKPFITPAYLPMSADENIARAKLVDRFNLVLGIGGGELARLQDAFISGAMPDDKAASFSNYCHFMIALATRNWEV